jgi:hypothetical protein
LVVLLEKACGAMGIPAGCGAPHYRVTLPYSTREALAGGSTFCLNRFILLNLEKWNSKCAAMYPIIRIAQCDALVYRSIIKAPYPSLADIKPHNIELAGDIAINAR